MDATMLVAVVIVALLAIAGVLLMRRNQSKHLEKRFGPEYRRAMHMLGSRDKAEAELLAREKRVKKLHLVPLSTQDAARLREAWTSIQARFVDNPKGVLGEADRLVSELMLKRGYPMGEFERCAADISVDHPRVVEHYRAAHDIALREHRGEADTEMLRQAVVHYRALFADLLEVAPPVQHEEKAPRERMRWGLPGRERAMAQREPRADAPREPASRNEREPR